MKRPLSLLVWIVLGLAATIFGLSWYLLSAWVPTSGKALLIKEIEQRAPVRVAIGAMRYDPFQGALAEQVLVHDRDTRAPLATIEQLHLRVGWLRLLLAKHAVFSGRAAVTLPVQAELSFNGTYDLSTQALRAEVDTSEIQFAEIAAPLDRYLPKPLTGGSARLRAEVRHRPGEPSSLIGRATGQRLIWVEPAWSATADLTADFRASRPDVPGQAWDYAIDVDVARGALEGVPTAGTLQELHGAATLTPDALEIHSLEGLALGVPWKTEGFVTFKPARRLELLVTAAVTAKTLATLLPKAAPEIAEASGSVNLRAVCRASLALGLAPDCLATAALDWLGAEIPSRRTTISRLTGQVQYEHLARLVTLTGLESRVNGEPVSVSGTIRTAPFTLDLKTRGTLLLEPAAAWLPAESPIASLQGLAEVDGRVRGAPKAWRATGRAQIRDAAVRLKAPDREFAQMNGLIVAEDERVYVNELAFRWHDQPMTLSASVGLVRHPRITATLALPAGEIGVQGQLTEEAFFIQDGRITFPQSRTQLRGRISRAPDGRSQLVAGGIVQLEELAKLPFVSRPQIDAWQLQGPVDLQVEFDGRLRDPAAASVTGRVHASRLSIKQLPVDDATCQFDHSARGFRVRLPAARVAGGELKGEFTLERRKDGADYFLTEADVVNLQLSELAALIPSWKTRQITGAVSSHALISGTWKQQATWRGEGWLNATGDRLADIPLLDRLLRGLFGVLGDRLGLEQLRRAEIKQAALTWRLAEARFATSDLKLAGYSGTEPVTIYGAGSVGLDQTLDFTIEPELSEGVVLESPTTSALAGTLLRAAGQLEKLRRLIGRHRITGTLKEPRYRFEVGTQDVLKELGPAPGELLQNLLNAVR